MKKGCLRILLTALVIAMAAGAITAVVGLFIKWNTPREFSDGLFWAGGILMVFGLISLLGGQGVRANIGMLYSESAGDRLADRTRRWVAGLAEDYSVLLYLFLAGLLLFGLSALVSMLTFPAP